MLDNAPTTGAGAGAGAAGGAVRKRRAAPKKKGICYNFSENGECRFGDGCRFSHGGDDDAEGASDAVAREPAAPGLCYQFRDNGSCRFVCWVDRFLLGGWGGVLSFSLLIILLCFFRFSSNCLLFVHFFCVCLQIR